MTDDDDYFVNTSSTQIINAAFDHRTIAEGKQRFECAHAARASGGEQNCNDFVHAKKINTKTRKTQSVIERTLCLRVFVVNSCGRLNYFAGGSQSSTRLPSGSMAQPNLPNS